MDVHAALAVVESGRIALGYGLLFVFVPMIIVASLFCYGLLVYTDWSQFEGYVEKQTYLGVDCRSPSCLRRHTKPGARRGMEKLRWLFNELGTATMILFCTFFVYNIVTIIVDAKFA
ncbi:hypothetical protein [Salinisphaera shabanensis]|uniref:hypothetical protein n=1 Tax=Salinisphaera shabanensis TaxID=180542 RepID=UPI00333F70A6